MKFVYIILIFIALQDELIVKTLLLKSPTSALGLSQVYHLPLNSEGNCSKIISFLETYKIPYLETYKVKTWGIFYKTRTRWNYKIEYRRSYRKEYECCDGFEFRVDSRIYPRKYSCEPICQPNCGNGTCVHPNVCSCKQGYRHDKTQISDSSCVPICTHSCIYGKCIAPEVCMCDSGYKLSDDLYICEPVCSVPCASGSYCYKPDQCLCLSGYEMINNDYKSANICQPICERECIHGKCIAPDTCTCDHGYEPDPYDLFACRPKCDGCLYGRCTAPNMCTCNEGYSLKTPNVCEPVCSKTCVMGTCVAPESCSCFTGYGLLENSKYVCEPVCEKACLNGRCTAPGVCTCNKGFQLSGDETEKHICKPHCEIPCEPFGTCTAPDVCTCFEGYRLAEKTRAKDIAQFFADNSICEPICDFPCVNGFCSAPSICTCNPGYHLPDVTKRYTIKVWCEPSCDQKCVHGFCSAPNTCTCHKGYRPSNSSNVCEPFCETECINGYCAAPNECTCESGYQPTEGNRTSLCEPICNPSCKNGICVRPDVCSCDPGYRSSTSPETNACDPICHPTCETNGICEAPDLCVCRDGYRMVYYDGGKVPFRCEPICDIECGNGTCTGPGLCVCIDGYRNAEIGGCEPVCTTGCGGNGTCVAPEVCECDDGFVLAEDLAEDLAFRAEGSRTSIDENGTANGSRCVPHCESCDDGECEAPGECQCHAGFVKIEGTCVHACQDGCGTHGECVEERRTCECDYGWTGLYCDRPILCVLILNDGNRTQQLTIIEEQNATIEHVLTNNPVCSECIDKVNNETLCFKMVVNDTKDETQIRCLMNEECLVNLRNQYKDQGNIIKLISGIAGGILLLTAIYLIFRNKHRNKRQMNLGNVQTRHSTSMQGLIESNANILNINS